MRLTLILLCLLFIISPGDLLAQRLWDIAILPGDMEQVGGNTTVGHLQNLMLRHHPGTDAAARILAVKYGESQREFILDILGNFYTDPTFPLKEIYDYNYYYFQGYYGEQAAISGMEILASDTGSRLDDTRIRAIRQLALAGRYEYFDTLCTFLPEEGSDALLLSVISIYGKDSSYRVRAGDILSDSISGSDNYHSIQMYAEFLASFDSARAISLLEPRLLSVSSDLRYWVFSALSRICPDEGPQWTIEALGVETNEFRQGNYFPDYQNIANGRTNESRRYCSPSFIKFTRDWLNSGISSFTRGEVKLVFYNPFKPLAPPAGASPLALIDSLHGLVDTMALFSWISDTQYKDWLSNLLDSASYSFVNGDSINGARGLKHFQQSVDEEYRDSLDGDSRSVTREGWKFLYYNAQYILDRLPAVPSQFELNLDIDGNGSVEKDPDLTLYDSSSTVELTAVPSVGQHFIGWSGDLSGVTNPASLLMDSDKTVTASFAIDTFTITATSGSNGSVSPPGVSSGTYGGSFGYSITANTGYLIDSLIVDGVPTAPQGSYTFSNVTANHTIRAVFRANQFTITATAGSNGMITPSGAVVVNYGGNQGFTITPGSCYHVDSVIVDGVNAGPLTSYTFTNLTANHTIRAVFRINTHTITPTAGANGSISPSTPQTVNCGGSKTFTMTPIGGYHVDSVIVNGTFRGTMSSYTFTNVRGDSIIRVVFRINSYTLTTLVSGSGNVVPIPFQETYVHGTNVTLKAIPGGTEGPQKEGGKEAPDSPEPGMWRFDHWEIDASGTSNPTTIQMTGNKTVRAVFVPVK